MNIYANKWNWGKKLRVLAVIFAAIFINTLAFAQISDDDIATLENRLKFAYRSKDNSDDIIWLNRILDRAELETETPSTGARKLCKLVIKHCQAKKGKFDIQHARAYYILADHSSTRKQDDILMKFVKLQAKIFRKAKTKDKPEFSQVLIDAYIRLGNHAISNLNKVKAKSYYKKASAVAKSVKSPLLDSIKSQAKRINDKIQAYQKTKELSQKLARNPKNAILRKQIIEIYISEADDIDAAVNMLSADLDEQTRAYVSLANSKLKSLSSASALELGNWYKSLQPRASKSAEPYLKYKELLCLKHFCNRQYKNTTQKGKILDRIASLKKVLKKAGFVFPTVSWSQNPEALKLAISPKIRDAIQKATLFLVKKQTVSGSWVENIPFGGTQDITGLATYSLLKAGLGKKSKAIQLAIKALAIKQDQKAYKLDNGYKAVAVAWRLLAFTEAYNRGFATKQRIAKDAKLLIKLTKNTTYSAKVTEKSSKSSGSAFPTFLAQYALAKANNTGYPVPRKFWSKAAKVWKSKQNKDGGWSAILGGKSGAVASATSCAMYMIACDMQNKKQKATLKSKVVKKAINYLDKYTKSYTTRHNRSKWIYSVYAIAASKLKIGKIQWYKSFSNSLLGNQKFNGAWGNSCYQENTALGLLALMAPSSE